MKCLACGKGHLKEILNFGMQPLANSYDNGKKYLLGLNFCPRCYHSQQLKFVDPKILYDDYAYVSGTTKTLDLLFKDFARRVTDKYGVGSVLDIASNDGSLLRHFKNLGWKVQGVDPAKNLRKLSKDIPTKVGYWNEEYSLKFPKYDIVIAFNVLAHNPNPLSFLKGMQRVAKKAIYIMTSQVDMFEKGEFDTIYHEHYSFFNTNSFMALFRRTFSKWLVSVTKENIHGGSYLFELSNPIDDYKPKVTKTLYKLLKIKQPFIGYGAAAKSVVMINLSGIRPEYVIDENPLKIGKVISGTNIKICSPERLITDKRNLTIVIFAWNFWAEIVGKIKKLRPNNKDRFVSPYDN